MKRLLMHFDEADLVGSCQRWRSIVNLDSALAVVDDLPGRNPRSGELVPVSRPGSARWWGHPEQIPAFFILEEDRVVAPWADQAVEAKFREVAVQLGFEVTEETAD